MDAFRWTQPRSTERTCDLACSMQVVWKLSVCSRGEGLLDLGADQFAPTVYPSVTSSIQSRYGLLPIEIGSAMISGTS